MHPSDCCSHKDVTRRLRVKLVKTGSELEGVGVHPGSADLTLKLKDVDPAEAPPLDANMSSKVRPWVGQLAHLKVKVCAFFSDNKSGKTMHRV